MDCKSSKCNTLMLVISILSYRFWLVTYYLMGVVSLLALTVKSSVAITTQTIGLINGTAPYLTFDEGATILYTTEKFLNIKLSDDSEILSTKDESSEANPIVLSGSSNTFASIKTSVPLSTEGNEDYPSITLGSLITGSNNYWGDDDGDNEVTTAGTVNVKWQTVDGIDVTKVVKNNPSKQFDGCDSPYKLTLTVVDGSLSTKYGIPSKTDFTDKSHSYYITQNSSQPKVYYAQPNISIDSSTSDNETRDRWVNGTPLKDLDGPDWVASKGFVPQNINNPIKNFPTTGSNNLRFYLLLDGISPSDVVAANGETVSSEIGGNVKLALSSTKTPGWGNTSKRVALQIVLQGPSKNSNDKSFTPMTFKLYSDKAKSNLLYSFRLERWFISLGARTYMRQSRAEELCKEMNYRLPYVSDFTNTSYKSGNNRVNWSGGIPNRNINNYRRQLSYKDENDKWIGGLLNEWGKVWSSTGNYPNSDWPLQHSDDWFWTSDRNYTIDAGEGAIDPSSSSYQGACVYP